MKILLADTNHETESEVRRVLDELVPDFEMITVTSGKECMEAVRNAQSPDIIFLGLNLADMSCFDFIENIRKNPGTFISKIPIVVLSYIKDGPIIERAFRLGADSYVAKPISHLELTRTVESLLSK
jgi:CheY-like chemotaxis protein